MNEWIKQRIGWIHTKKKLIQLAVRLSIIIFRYSKHVVFFRNYIRSIVYCSLDLSWFCGRVLTTIALATSACIHIDSNPFEWEHQINLFGFVFYSIFFFAVFVAQFPFYAWISIKFDICWFSLIDQFKLLQQFTMSTCTLYMHQIIKHALRMRFPFASELAKSNSHSLLFFIRLLYSSFTLANWKRKILLVWEMLSTWKLLFRVFVSHTEKSKKKTKKNNPTSMENSQIKFCSIHIQFISFSQSFERVKSISIVERVKRMGHASVKWRSPI